MPSRFRLHDLTIDLARQRVDRDSSPLDVQGLSFRLLACLVERGDRVVGFDELMETVWAPAVVNEETVTQRVRLLRQSLGDDARAPRYIRTVRGRGYQLGEPPIAIDDTATNRRLSPWPALAAVLLLAAVALGAGFLAREQKKPVTGPQQELLERARWYAAMGQRDNNERALALYDRALRQSPDDIAALTGASRARAARTCLYNHGADDARDALRLAERATGLRSDDAVAWSALGYARDCLGDARGAIAAYERAVRLDPNDDATRSSAAYLYQEMGRLADALQANLDMRGDPSKVRYREVQIAREYELMGFMAQAEAHYRHAFDLAPDNVFANIAWPAFLFAQQRFDEAAAAIAEARQRGVSRAELEQLDGEIALHKGNRDTATRYFRQALALRPQSSVAKTLADLYASAQVDTAWVGTRIAQFKSTQIDNPWPASRLELAVLSLAIDDRQGAVSALSDAADLGWRDARYLQASPLFRSLSGDPSFQRVLDTMRRRADADRMRVLTAKWCPSELPCSM
ncbi:MAG: Transcriptional activator CadC [Luteibacter sp.]|uniref:winged helix-turn-helix transcriptional regulator n=1 Tax=Luteibacter sp. TaxID=1886636 RepID=UPI00137CFD7E|nr:winged helix-turn-helix transcriptional regulator [Luteibacter sp.]KAF1006330.1 MAG: Transcriptional activator CadC [Luteibacter sp.]